MVLRCPPSGYPVRVLSTSLKKRGVMGLCDSAFTHRVAAFFRVPAVCLLASPSPPLPFCGLLVCVYVVAPAAHPFLSVSDAFLLLLVDKMFLASYRRSSLGFFYGPSILRTLNSVGLSTPQKRYFLNFCNLYAPSQLQSSLRGPQHWLLC